MIGALVFAAATATADLSDRTDARLRFSSGQTPALDVANTPTINLQMQAHQWLGDVFYAPSIQVQNLVPPPAQPTFLNTLALTSTWLENHARISLIEDGTVGEESTAYLGGLQAGQQTPPTTTMTPGMMTPTMAPALQFIPQQTKTVWFASSRSLLFVGLQPSKRWQLALDVGYYIYGGLDDSARQVLPLQRGPVGDASAAYIFNDVDRFIANVNAQRLEFAEGPCLALLYTTNINMGMLPECAPDEYIAVGTVGWSHALSRLSTASVSVGASAVRSRLNLNSTDEFQTHVYPAGLLTYQYRTGILRRPTTLRIDAQVTPAVDNLTGVAENRAQLLATAVWTGARFKLSEVLGVAHTLGSPLDPPSTFVLTSSSVLYSLSKLAVLSAELDYVWQQQERVGAYSALVASFSFIVHAPIQRF
jgi:hypothetical protein